MRLRDVRLFFPLVFHSLLIRIGKIRRMLLPVHPSISLTRYLPAFLSISSIWSAEGTI
jgi:hypothetical protein